MNARSMPSLQPLPSVNKAVPASHPALFSACLFIVALCLGVLVRSLEIPFLTESFRSVPIFELPGLLALFAGLLSAVVFHETGHLWAALLNDFEISGIVIGPFYFLPSGRGWKLALKSYRLSEACVSAFPRTEQNWQRRMLMVVAAGPLATLVTGVAAVFFLHGVSQENTWLIWFLQAFVQISFFFFVLGLIPNGRTALIQNDATLFRSLWRTDPPDHEIFLYHLVLQQQRLGVRPRNYAPELIARLAHFEGRTDFMAFYATTLAAWAFDTDNPEAGSRWDRRALDLRGGCGLPVRNLVTVNSACFDILYRQCFLTAQAKLNSLDRRRIAPPYLRYRAIAALHLSGQKLPEALADITAAHFSLPKYLRNAGTEGTFLSLLHAKVLNGKN